MSGDIPIEFDFKSRRLSMLLANLFSWLFGLVLANISCGTGRPRSVSVNLCVVRPGRGVTVSAGRQHRCPLPASPSPVAKYYVYWQTTDNPGSNRIEDIVLYSHFPCSNIDKIEKEFSFLPAAPPVLGCAVLQ